MCKFLKSKLDPKRCLFRVPTAHVIGVVLRNGFFRTSNSKNLIQGSPAGTNELDLIHAPNGLSVEQFGVPEHPGLERCRCTFFLPRSTVTIQPSH
jgi:hypothetical protein